MQAGRDKRVHGFVAAALSALLPCTMVAQQSAPSAQIAQLIRAGQYDQAVTLARAAEHTSPKDPRLFTLEAVALSLQGKREQALPAFEHALALAPNDPAALRGEAELLYPTHDPRAIPLLERILAHNPSDTTANEMLANLQRAAGSCTAANQHFAAAGDSIQTHPGSLESFGACLSATRQPDKAIPVFQQLVALEPESNEAKYDLALVSVEAGQYAAALQWLRPLLAAHPADSDLATLAATAYEGTGDTPEAVATLREAIVQHPAEADLYAAFARLCLDHDSFQVGIDMINAGLERVPNSPVLFVLRGLLYAQLTQYDKAEADFAAADRLDEHQALGAYATDLAELQKNEVEASHPEAAIARLRTQVKTHPTSAMLHYLLARLLLTQANPSPNTTREAVDHLLAAIKLAPDFVPAHDLLASQYLQQARYPQAVEQCRAALQYAPQDQTALYHLVTALRHSPKTEDREQIKPLLAQLGSLQKASLQQETDQKRFRLSEATPPPQR